MTTARSPRKRLQAWPDLRVGWGFDTHRLVRGRPLILAGVRLPHTHGLKGHSDADVAAHAVIDALLGAAGEGDIGLAFPDTDPRWKGADSLKLLAQVAQRLAKRFQLQHLDLTLWAESPRIGPFRQRMRLKLARALGLPIERVNLKAKTNEKMGFVGRKEGLAACAVATLIRR